MEAQKNPGAGGTAHGASGNVQAGNLNNFNYATSTETLQAARVRRDFGLPPLLAQLIATHAFASGGAP